MHKCQVMYVFPAALVLHDVKLCFDIFPLMISTETKKKQNYFCVN